MPSRYKTVAKIEASRIEPFYSYGDSSGIEPDSHFNPDLNRETNYNANVKAIIYEFKNELYTCGRNSGIISYK